MLLPFMRLENVPIIRFSVVKVVFLKSVLRTVCMALHADLIMLVIFQFVICFQLNCLTLQSLSSDCDKIA